MVSHRARGAAGGGRAQGPMQAKPKKPRAENAARRTLQMLEATLRSVARHGLARTTLASVSAEAGLSQGVAVFYFESKDKLLAAAFRRHYEIYRQNWLSALEAAGPGPAARIAAIVAADFDPAVFNRESIAVWHAFWGDSTARPLYADIALEFDSERGEALAQACVALPGETEESGRELAVAIDAMTDGLWLRAHLSPDWAGVERSGLLAARFLARLGCAPAGPETRP